MSTLRYRIQYRNQLAEYGPDAIAALVASSSLAAKLLACAGMLQHEVSYKKQIQSIVDALFAKKITDVSMLGNIHSLILGYCDGVRDVSKLSVVYDLKLSCLLYTTDAADE